MGGKTDSTKTRVVPTFNAIAATDPQWLRRLLALPSFGAPRAAVDYAGDLEVMECHWGDSEQPLPAPLSLLRWLVQNLEVKPPDNDHSPAASSRRRLCERDPGMIESALRHLDRDTSRGNWWVLEGPSYPDVYVTTPSAIVVIEGKRTEAGPTVSTTWMPFRHQMLRHLDGAWELRGNKRLYGFFIVEGEGRGEVPALWRAAAQNTVTHDTLRRSLPHRTESERAAIASCFLGVTTWQAVREAFELDPAVLHETC